MRIIGLFLLAFFEVARCQINIQLLANWENPPFELRLLETISSENAAYYIPILALIGGFPAGDDEESPKPETDEDLYNNAFSMLTPTESSLYDIALANKYHSPRIIAHYKYYNESVLPIFEAKLKKKCGGVPRTWLQFNDVVYCDPDDVYALMTDALFEDNILPFDRVIGTDGPHLVLYGDVKDEKFAAFVAHLYDAASSGKLRFSWRYVPQNIAKREVLSGYGVDLTLKRTDYIVIDDRDVRTGDIETRVTEIDELSSSLLDVYDDDIKAIDKDDIQELDLKLASYVLASGNNSEMLSTLKSIVEELPKFSSYLVGQEINQDLLAQLLANQNIGISSESTGIFLNGKLLDTSDQNIFGLYREIKNELSIVENINGLGIKSERARHLIEKFALMSLYKSRSRKGSRYRIPKSQQSPVIFFNDIEKDAIYREYSDDVSSYIGRFAFGQIPQVKSNLQTIIFVVDLTEKDDVAMLNNVIESVEQNVISQRIGIIPVVSSEEGRAFANDLYFHYLGFDDSKGVKEYIKKLIEPDHSPEGLSEIDYVSQLSNPFMEAFDVKGPQIIVNGVFYPLDSNWPYSLTRQVTEDVGLILGIVYQKMASTFDEVEELLFEDALPFRNTLLFPPDKSKIEYKFISKPNLDELAKLSPTVVEYTPDSGGDFIATLTFAGDFGLKLTMMQLREILILSGNSDVNLKLRLIHTADGPSFLGKVKQSLHFSAEHALSIIDDILSKNQFGDEDTLESPSVRAILSEVGITSDKFLLVNGRYISLNDQVLSSSILKFFLDEEFKQRLGLIQRLIGPELKSMDNQYDWYECLCSVLTFSLVARDDKQLGGSISRFDFSRLNTDPAISFGNRTTSDVHVLVVVDPAQELSQKLISLASVVKDLPFASLDIVLVPKMEINELPVKRFYKANFKNSVSFLNGMEHEDLFVNFKNTPEKTLFTLDIDGPPSWIVIPKESASDLDNVLLSQSGPVTGIYELESIIIEGNAIDIVTKDPPTGLAVQIPGSDTYVMTNYGYFQLKANPGLWDFSIKKGKWGDLYSLLSVQSSDIESTESHESLSLALFNMDGLHIHPRVTKKPGKESESLIISDSETYTDQRDSRGGLSSWFKSGKKKQADINIFSVASGHLYERLLSIMTVSVMRHTKHTVKFWLIDNYMSPTFRKFLPYLSEKYGFEYELINYKWPSWLRGQREKQRTIWGYKILFLDVLFPQDLDKVIFVDADQIVRADMMELVDMDLEGAPYGYTPMGDSRKEMEGFRFWKQGYWKTFLGDSMKYHISALYVIDLKKFRSIAAGDKLRQHYQALSRDPGSLSNLDQDLPNNLQPQLKIFSLPQEWLWCETWCDDQSLKTAKTIDLCNNPLTKEPKLDRARRQIPEWNVYDSEINSLRDEVFMRSDELVETTHSTDGGTAIGTEPELIDHDEL